MRNSARRHLIARRNFHANKHLVCRRSRCRCGSCGSDLSEELATSLHGGLQVGLASDDAVLKEGKRIYWRTCTSGHYQRAHYEQELPPVELASSRGCRLKILIVENRDSEGIDRQDVDRH